MKKQKNTLFFHDFQYKLDGYIFLLICGIFVNFLPALLISGVLNQFIVTADRIYTIKIFIFLSFLLIIILNYGIFKGKILVWSNKILNVKVSSSELLLIAHVIAIIIGMSYRWIVEFFRKMFLNKVN